MELDAETLAANEDADLLAYVWATGASLKRDVHVHIALFPDEPVPDGYTAIL